MADPEFFFVGARKLSFYNILQNKILKAFTKYTIMYENKKKFKLLQIYKSQ